MIEPIAKVGTRVRITKDNACHSGFRTGDEGEITEVGLNDFMVCAQNGDAWWHNWESCEIIPYAKLVHAISIQHWGAAIRVITYTTNIWHRVLTFAVPARVQIIASYQGNTTISTIMVEPRRTMFPSDYPYSVFNGIAYKRAEDNSSWLEGIKYSCKNALQVGVRPRDKDISVTFIQRDLWRSVRILLQTLEEQDDYSLKTQARYT